MNTQVIVLVLPKGYSVETVTEGVRVREGEYATKREANVAATALRREIAGR